jgi:hypothetical protein
MDERNCMALFGWVVCVAPEIEISSSLMQLVAGLDLNRCGVTEVQRKVVKMKVGEAIDEMICTIMTDFQYGSDERDHDALRRTWTTALDCGISCGSSAAD